MKWRGEVERYLGLTIVGVRSDDHLRTQISLFCCMFMQRRALDSALESRRSTLETLLVFYTLASVPNLASNHHTTQP